MEGVRARSVIALWQARGPAARGFRHRRNLRTKQVPPKAAAYRWDSIAFVISSYVTMPVTRLISFPSREIRTVVG